MTGKWTPRHGIYTVGSSERGRAKDRKLVPTKNQETLSKEHVTIPEILQSDGYQTCHAGKWHLSQNPSDYGFDVNIGGGHNGFPRSYYYPFKNVEIEGGEGQYLTDYIMQKALGFIDTVNAPFFINYSPYAIHKPIMPVESLLGKYQEKPAWNGQNNAEYVSMVENLDRNIGLLIGKFKEKGVYDKTFIIFTSDNGGVFGVTNQHPLRAGKGSYYEGGIREPFFFVLPEKIAPNSTSDVPITNLDILPTIMHYAQVDKDVKTDGLNLSPLLEQKSTELNRALFWHFPIYLEAYLSDNKENRDTLFRTRPGSVVRYGSWKLHYYFENNEVELYNLEEDISEQNDLSVINPSKKDELLKILKNWWKETKAPIPTTLNPEYAGS